jgi:hypothetical protein
MTPIITIVLRGKDADAALAQLVSNVQYDKLDVEIYTDEPTDEELGNATDDDIYFVKPETIVYRKG